MGCPLPRPRSSLGPVSFLGAIESGFSALGDRIRNPFAGSFVLAWAGFNWRSLYVTFFLSEDKLPFPYTDKLTYVTQGLDHSLGTLLLFPLGVGIALTFLLPAVGGWSSLKVNSIKDHFDKQDAEQRSTRYYKLGTLDRYERRIDTLTEALNRAEAERDRHEGNLKTERDKTTDLTEQLSEKSQSYNNAVKGAEQLQLEVENAKSTLESTKTEHEQALEALKAEHQQALESLRTKMEAEVDKIAKAKEDSEAELRGQVVKALNDLVEADKRHMEDLESERANLRRLLAGRSVPEVSKGQSEELSLAEEVHLQAERLFGNVKRYPLEVQANYSRGPNPLGTLLQGLWEKRWPATQLLDATNPDREELATIDDVGLYQVENGWPWRLSNLTLNVDGSIAFEQSGPEPTRYICLYALSPNRYVGVEGYQPPEEPEPRLYRVEYKRVGVLSEANVAEDLKPIPVEEWYDAKEGLLSIFGSQPWEMASTTTDDPPVTVRANDKNRLLVGAIAYVTRSVYSDGTELALPLKDKNSKDSTLVLSKVAPDVLQGRFVDAEGEHPVEFRRLHRASPVPPESPTRA